MGSPSIKWRIARGDKATVAAAAAAVFNVPVDGPFRKLTVKMRFLWIFSSADAELIVHKRQTAVCPTSVCLSLSLCVCVCVCK